MSESYPIPPGQPIPEPGVEPDGIDTPTLLMWGLVSVVIVIGLIFASAALFFRMQNDFNTERVIRPNYVDSDEVVLRQQGLLAKFEAPTAEGQPYIIPIDLAEELVLAELRKQNDE